MSRILHLAPILPAGEFQVQWKVENLDPGIYLNTLYVGERREIQE